MAESNATFGAAAFPIIELASAANISTFSSLAYVPELFHIIY